MGSKEILVLTDDTFHEKIGELNGPVLVDFWAGWCRPCKLIAPSLEKLAEELAGKATIAKVDVDDNGDLSNRFGIRSIPTLIVFRNGKVVDQKIGNVPKDQIRRMLEKHL